LGPGAPGHDDEQYLDSDSFRRMEE
jgi:hypothetical protein